MVKTKNVKNVKPEMLVNFEKRFKEHKTLELFFREAALLKMENRPDAPRTDGVDFPLVSLIAQYGPWNQTERVYDKFRVHGNVLRPLKETYNTRNGISVIVRKSSVLYTPEDYAGHGSTQLQLDIPLYFVDESGSGNVWKADCTCTGYSAAVKDINYNAEYSCPVECTNIKFSGWKKFRKLEIAFFESQVLNPEEAVYEAVSLFFSPQALDFFLKEGFQSTSKRSAVLMLMAPELEQLSKAGYAFAGEVIRRLTGRDRLRGDESAWLERFNRLVQPGRNLKEIFKTSKAVYSLLKDEKDLKLWDEYRKFDKFGRIPAAALRDFYESDAWTDPRDLAEYQKILSAEYKGKRVFTFETLGNYLGRLDQYEAISPAEALPILRDYLQMCRQLEMAPKIDGDSLKREHDIAARLCREKRDEKMAKAMEGACESLSRFDYEERIFLIRGVKSYDDLLDEAKQQHNCVASYSYAISKGKSMIYFLREKGRPDKSFVTVELEIVGGVPYIRQKYMAFNRPVRNKAVTEFLARWLNVVKIRIAEESGINVIKTA